MVSSDASFSSSLRPLKALNLRGQVLIREECDGVLLERKQEAGANG